MKRFKVTFTSSVRYYALTSIILFSRLIFFKKSTTVKCTCAFHVTQQFFVYSLYTVTMAHRRKSLAPHHENVINAGDRKKVSELVGKLENASQVDLGFIDSLGDGKTRINRRKSLSITPFKAAALFASAQMDTENSHTNLVQSDPVIEKSHPSTPVKSSKRYCFIDTNYCLDFVFRNLGDFFLNND